MAVQKPSAGAAGGVIDADLDRWRSAVAGVLAKSSRRDPAELPAEPERLLDSPTYEGFAMRPLYTAADERARTRAARAAGRSSAGETRLRDVKSGWKVAEVFPAQAAPADEGNGAVLLALTEGVSALVLRVGDGPAWPRPSSTGCSTASSSTWSR